MNNLEPSKIPNSLESKQTLISTISTNDSDSNKTLVPSPVLEKSLKLMDPRDSVNWVNVDDTFEALLRTYEHCQHWITLADTKAGLILTIHGVLSGFLIQYIPKIQQAFWLMSPVERYLVSGTLAIYFIFQLLSFLFTVQVFFPRQLKIDYQKTCHVFPIGLQTKFPRSEDREKFWEEYKTLTEEDLKLEYAMQFHTDGLICNKKYQYLKGALKTLFIAGFLAFLSFAFIQFFVIRYTL
ncbi:MAG: hypothetical protein AABZ60_02440 [Planctomycetota bacterium]